MVFHDSPRIAKSPKGSVLILRGTDPHGFFFVVRDSWSAVQSLVFRPCLPVGGDGVPFLKPVNRLKQNLTIDLTMGYNSTMKKLSTKDYILKQLRAKGEIRSGDVVRALNLSRQTVTQHFQELAQERKVSRLGSTIDSRYIPYVSPEKRKAGASPKIGLIRTLKGLSEDHVFDQIDLQLQLKKSLSPQAYKICAYAFCEMLNNAIDHSKSKTATIEFSLIGGSAEFWIKDAGIGAFESVRRAFKLQDHLESVEHLMKGKQTSMPSRHSGQGIFFTSRAADLFFIESAKLKWLVDNQSKDVSLEQLKKSVKGTWVYFSVKQKTRRDLGQLFRDYADDDFEFDKTEVRVKLSKKQGEYVSRSEARRILFGLDKFKRIIFDFEDVSSIGQAFADEVFRVFQKQHPKIKIESVRTNSAVQFMINRALAHGD